MAERGDGGEQPFEMLPDEMVVHVLSFVDADSLLNCRPVSKQWRKLVDAYAFQEKAARENDWVNNGRGYHSFSQIDTNTVRKLDLPWYVFYAICKYDPFNKNLVENHCGQNQFDGWTIPRFGPDSQFWIIEPKPVGACELPDDPDFEGHTCCFASTYFKCSKTQLIEFKSHGFTEKILSFFQPEIVVSEWYSGRFDCGCKYKLNAILYDNKNELLEQFHCSHVFDPRLDANVWNKISHSFKNFSNVSHLVFNHSGQDTQFWAGHYGTKISGSVVKILLPLKLKSSLPVN